MKTSIFLVALATMFSQPILADHASENAWEISRAAYQVADSAEAIEVEAYRMLGGVLNPTNDDHRHDTLVNIYHRARATHLAASDLYRATRTGLQDDNENTDDHRGDAIRRSYQQLRYQYDALRSLYNQSRFDVGYRLRYLFDGLARSFANLDRLVWGPRPE